MNTMIIQQVAIDHNTHISHKLSGILSKHSASPEIWPLSDGAGMCNFFSLNLAASAGRGHVIAMASAVYTFIHFLYPLNPI